MVIIPTLIVLVLSSITAIFSRYIMSESLLSSFIICFISVISVGVFGWIIGLNKIEKPLNASKVMICCPSCEKATRVGHEVKDGKKVRVCQKCGETIDV